MVWPVIQAGQMDLPMVGTSSLDGAHLQQELNRPGRRPRAPALIELLQARECGDYERINRTFECLGNWFRVRRLRERLPEPTKRGQGAHDDLVRSVCNDAGVHRIARGTWLMGA
jgi:hypothetical protein